MDHGNENLFLEKVTAVWSIAVVPALMDSPWLVIETCKNCLWYLHLFFLTNLGQVIRTRMFFEWIGLTLNSINIKSFIEFWLQ